MSAEDAATPFQVWMFICPGCGGQIEIGEDLTDGLADCYDCGQTVELAS